LNQPEDDAIVVWCGSSGALPEEPLGYRWRARYIINRYSVVSSGAAGFHARATDHDAALSP
jgi:hypothetical protein